MHPRRHRSLRLLLALHYNLLPGKFVVVPENTPHAFSNPGAPRTTVLIMFCPADSREQYFEGLAE
jgi:quercetin dioxygenase-like cupin family protein